MPKKKRKSRRARGTGSIFYHEGRGRWVGRKVVGKTPAGKSVYVERWGATQGEVVRRLDEAGPPDPNVITVAGWAARWRDTLNVRPSTKHDYLVSIDQHVLPVLGHMRLSAVTTSHIEGLIAKLSATAEPSTVRKIVTHARILFAAASRADVVPKNVVAHARKPRVVSEPVEVLTPAQLVAVIKAAQEYEPGGVIAVLAGVGARIGEVLALDVEDWNAADKTFTITKTYNKRFGVGPTKSRHSRRTISIPDVLFPVVAAAVAGRTAGPLFATPSGQRRSGQAVWDAWKAIRRGVKLKPISIHALRHSVATQLIAAGVPIPDVAKYIGDTVQTLVRCYVHPTWADPAHTLNRLYGVQRVGAPGPTGLDGLEIKVFGGTA